MDAHGETGSGRKGHPIFAAFYGLLTKGSETHGWMGQRRTTLLAGLRGRILEIGAGTWANLPHYPDAADVTGIEPDPHMRKRAHRQKQRTGRKAQMIDATAEHLPFADDYFDHVVSTHVFCSVSDPHRAATEVRRVLKPGGQLHIIEHVRAKSPSAARFQDLITPVWRRLGAGCHPNRDTLTVLQQAGFHPMSVEREKVGPYPIKPHIVGVLQRPPFP